MTIEALITELVQAAPVMDPAIVAALQRELAACDGVRAPLAAVIARVVDLVAAGAVDPGISLPHLAMACASLVAPSPDARVLAAAQYEIETLLPVPGAPPPRPTAPDVPLIALKPRRGA